MQEIWNPIPGFENYYEASNQGRIRSCDREASHPNGSYLRTGRILAQQSTNRRYAVVSLSVGGKMKTCKVHRLVAAAHLPNPEGCPEVNHIDGNKFNNSSSNLEWVSRLANVAHAISTGLKPPIKGVAHGMSKLSEKNVLEIRSEYAEGVSMPRLAKKHGVSLQSISNIVHRRNWAHI